MGGEGVKKGFGGNIKGSCISLGMSPLCSFEVSQHGSAIGKVLTVPMAHVIPSPAMYCDRQS